jgi:hypothetical protein
MDSAKIEKCKAIMLEYFGPASANNVENMGDSEDAIISSCRHKVSSLIGQEKAKAFDNI